MTRRRPLLVALAVILAALLVPACEAGLLDDTDAHVEIGGQP